MKIVILSLVFAFVTSAVGFSWTCVASSTNAMGDSTPAFVALADDDWIEVNDSYNIGTDQIGFAVTRVVEDSDIPIIWVAATAVIDSEYDNWNRKAKFRVRFDQDKPITVTWIIGENLRNMTVSGSTYRNMFLQEMLVHDELILEIELYPGATRFPVFDLNGFAEVYTNCS